jgi:hypothetical protein
VVLPAVLHKPSVVAVCRNALPVPPPEAEMLMRIPFATALRRRLLPLHVAVALQGFMLWVPVEKLFMNEIGFDAAAVGVMAAAYAAVVPLVEIPSGSSPTAGAGAASWPWPTPRWR